LIEFHQVDLLLCLKVGDGGLQSLCSVAFLHHLLDILLEFCALIPQLIALALH